MRLLLTADPELPVPPRLYGGIERLVDLWIRELRARGHQVALCAHPDSTAPVDAFFPWPGRRSRSPADALRNTLALAAAARRFRADIVHSSSRLIYTLPLLLARTPVVMTYHRFPSPRPVRAAARLGGSRLVFTGVSDFISRLGSRSAGNWQTVHNCMDVAACPFVPDTPPHAPLAFVSRIEEVKGAHLAIDIARAAGRPIVLAGNHSADANAARYWREQIQPRLDGVHARYIGPVDDAGRNRLFGASSALLLPVQWDEPFGLVAVEALACGTPVVATPRGGLPEIVRPGLNGYLAADADSAVRALASLPAINRAACRADAEQRFAVPRAVDRFLQIYQTLLPASPRARQPSGQAA